MKVKVELVEDDILNQAEWADAIVNCATNTLLCGGGLCGTIFEAAGREKLEDACRDLGPKEVGECVITDGYNIPSKIIHAVGSRYNWNRLDNIDILVNTYKNIIKIAEENNIKKIAFPLVSSGIYAYPLRVASKIAAEVLSNLQSDVIEHIKLVLYSPVYYLACKEAFNKVTA